MYAHKVRLATSTVSRSGAWGLTGDGDWQARVGGILSGCTPLRKWRAQDRAEKRFRYRLGAGSQPWK